MFYRLALYVMCALLSGCGTPAERFRERATRHGLVSQVANTKAFEHVVFRNALAQSAQNDTLHLYLDGDGTPFVTRDQIATDPTTRDALVIDLMAQDTSPAILLGRPCYYQHPIEAACGLHDWTSARYSERVVASLVAAATDVIRDSQAQQVVLIGYSGGGVLATLLAPRLPKVTAVITIAANLDTDAWTALHGYSPLGESLNPARQPPLPPAIAVALVWR